MKYKGALPVVAFALGMITLCAAAANATSITAEQVASALTLAGLNATAQQVRLPVNVTSRSAHPVLKVMKVDAWRDRYLRVRVECSDHVECLPFFVTLLHYDAQSDALHVLAERKPAERNAASPVVAAPIVVHAGSHANLLLEGQHIRIQLPVVCLQDGRVGQFIHATGKGLAQSFFAEVLDSTDLKGRLL